VVFRVVDDETSDDGERARRRYLTIDKQGIDGISSIAAVPSRAARLRVTGVRFITSTDNRLVEKGGWTTR
jgi:hypothetical protein